MQIIVSAEHDHKGFESVSQAHGAKEQANVVKVKSLKIELFPIFLQPF